MSRMEDHTVYGVDEDGNDTGQPVARVYPASEASVTLVLAASEEDGNGRSNWMWVRLASGDLILGVFPQGDTYFATEHDHSF